MVDKKKFGLKRSMNHQNFQVLIFIIAILLILTILLLWSLRTTQTESEPERVRISTMSFDQLDQEDTNISASEPTLLEIPSVDLKAKFRKPLGLNKDGTIEAPKDFETISRYKHFPTPGEKGPSVILGHVDSYEGPAIFWPLRDVKEGDSVYISREDGSIVTFSVYKTEIIEQDKFPTEKVYGETEESEIRLVTCSGYYDQNRKRYSHNLIIYGILEEADLPDD